MNYFVLIKIFAPIICVSATLLYINHLRFVITTKKGELITALSQVASYKHSVEVQNSAIEQLQTDATARQALNVVALAKAKQESIVYKDKAAVIINRPAPPNTSSCNAANDLINEELF